jgi:phosphate uptake regulator
MWKEIISVFKKDNLYQQAFDEACEMLETDGKMYVASVESLRKSDTAEMELDIYGLDKEVNRSERDVRKKVMKHLMLSGDTQLNSGLALVSVVIDIERIGDYTKNIYDLARSHPKRLQAGSLEDKLQKVEAHIAQIFASATRAFKEGDEDIARQVMEEYKEEISTDCDDMADDIITGKVSDLEAPEAAAVVLYARFLKRIGSHSRNIATSIVNPFHRIGYNEKRKKDPKTGITSPK